LKWNDQQQQNDVYHHQEDDWMPAINKQVDLSYGHDHRMIRSYQSLCGRHQGNIGLMQKYRNDVNIGMDTNQDRYSLTSVDGRLNYHETNQYILTICLIKLSIGL